MYAVPILAHGSVVGAINFGYGDPPGDPETLRKLASAYHLDYDELVREVDAYDSRPPFIIELAKKRLHATARIIGSMIETEQSEEALRQRLAYEQLLNDVSTMAFVAEDLAAFHDRCLTLVGETLGVDRAYMFRHDDATDTMDNTHEWCAPGIAPQQDELQGIPGSTFSWWLQTMRRNEIICYPSIEEIPDEATKEMLRSQDIESILVVPLFVKAQYYGFLGLDDCARRRAWRQEDVDILRSLTRVVAMATERALAERERRQSDERFHSFFMNLAAGSCLDEIVYEDGRAVDYRILDVNPAYERIMGIPRENAAGALGSQLYGLGQAPFLDKLERVAETGVPQQFEAFFAPAGKQLSFTVSRPRPGMFSTVFFDVTERRRAEAEKESLQSQLLQAQKMESVGRLAGGLAHDFNNMLGVILGHAEMALERMDPDQPFYVDFKEIKRAAERSAGLTRQLLTFARKQTIAPRIIDLNVTVERTLKMLRRLIGEDIDLAWLAGSNLGPVKVDPSQIDQILINLCVNARDAIDDVGKITIETDAVSFDEAYCAVHAGFVPGEYVLLAVSDNGCGMDPQTVGHLFEPFFTTKEQGKGTGLGLASVYGAVKQNNGFINVYSEPGQGTTFRIYLPQHHTRPASQADQASATPAARGSETILLVEDEPAILRLATMMLERLGYVVIAAETPGEAIRLAQEHSGPIDLLMTDVVMPEMNGRDLAKNLLSIYPDIKRLFMSGYTANVIAHHGVLDEGVCFIQKPFSPNQLGGKLREVLDDKHAD